MYDRSLLDRPQEGIDLEYVSLRLKHSPAMGPHGLIFGDDSYKMSHIVESIRSEPPRDTII